MIARKPVAVTMLLISYCGNVRRWFACRIDHNSKEPSMKLKTLEDLIDWTRLMHKHLGQSLKNCSRNNTDARAKWLLEYLSEHEKALEKTVAEFEKQADPKALRTWVYDYLCYAPVGPYRRCDKPYATMSFDEICEEIFSTHGQITDLYRSLAERAETPQTRNLLLSLLKMEENKAMRMAQQINRSMDL